MKRSVVHALGAASLSFALALGVFQIGACGPLDREPEHAGGKSKDAGCPPPPEPTYQSMVVGTIGKYHLVESRYPLTRIGDAITAFKPDLLLLAVRVDPYREGRLEDASFEMTYANFVAKERGIAVEPIDWFRDDELGVTPPNVEPWDAREIVARESAVLREPKLFTFERANASELAERVLLAMNSEARYRAGNGAVTRRGAWISQLAASAVGRHQKPKRVMAVVDVFDRPELDLFVHGLGYANQEPTSALDKAKEVMMGDVPPEVLAEYRAELGRARSNLREAKGAMASFWADRVKVLEVALEKKAGCCVPTSALTTESAKPAEAK